jgi:prophage regulatory protein
MNKPDIIFLRLPSVLQILPVSKSTWWKGVSEGMYPKPVKLSPRTAAWLKTDIDALIEKISRGE